MQEWPRVSRGAGASAHLGIAGVHFLRGCSGFHSPNWREKVRMDSVIGLSFNAHSELSPHASTADSRHCRKQEEKHLIALH